MRKTVLTIFLILMAWPAMAQDNRGIDFRAMDTNADGRVTQSEWMVWFLPDARARLMPSPQSVVPQGQVARPMLQHSDESQFVSDMFNRELRGHALNNGPTLAERLERMRAFDGRQEPTQPDFSMFDKNGDGLITSEEMPRRVTPVPYGATGPSNSQNY